MKRTLIILALVSLAIPEVAAAEHSHGGRGRGHGEGRAERRFNDHDRGRRDVDRGPRFGPRFRLGEDAFRDKPGKGPRYGRPAPPPGRRMGLGRGQTLPPQMRGPRLEDYGRYRLRRPPAGYSYHRHGNRVYLLSDDTGMIFEVVPLGR
jgi:Ni/Co efflux regulator RcnB